MMEECDFDVDYGTDEVCNDSNGADIDDISIDNYEPYDDTIYTYEDLSTLATTEPPCVPPYIISRDLAEQVYNGCKFSDDYWENLSESAKVDELNKLEDNLAVLQGREPVQIQIKDLDSFWDNFTGRKRLGYFDPNTGEIYVNSSLLKSPQMLPYALDTVIHEGIHAYQYKCVTGEIEHDDPSQVEEWAENFKNYKTARLYGMEIYQNQPLEKFARERAEQINKREYYA